LKEKIRKKREEFYNYSFDKQDINTTHKGKFRI
jgi:hypothetical protein